tara:strand:- start:275 stop:715 length:441 start_codon:yes stop_codon:yes gene_type:complete
MKINFRSSCPIASALDVIGDKWILVIVKQMLFDRKQTFKEFIESDEGIATNILTIKLKLLVKLKIVKKSKLPNNKKSIYYNLTDKGLSLATVLIELALWSDKNLREHNIIMLNSEIFTKIKSNKVKFINSLIETYKKKLAKTMYIR